MTEKVRVLFICTANAARSQMAEGYMRAKYGNRYEVFSAGTRQSTVSTRAITVMNEIGIDISHHKSKTLAALRHESFDIAVTLCDNVLAVCPFVPNAERTIHKGFPDPHLTPGSGEEILNGYRRVRDEIIAWIDKEFGAEDVNKYSGFTGRCRRTSFGWSRLTKSLSSVFFMSPVVFFSRRAIPKVSR